nr:hypothetical protein [Buchnera aphidicola]
MSKINFFSKKILAIIIIVTIMLSIIFNSIVIYFIKDYKNHAILINNEKISPKIIQCLYSFKKKYHQNQEKNKTNDLETNFYKNYYIKKY